jgi:hypothetical protein
MAPKNVIIALLAVCSMGYAQTRSLLVDTSGVVQYTNNPVQWQTALSFGANAAATRSNLSLGLSALTNTSNAGLLSAIGGLTTNGSAAALTNFPAYLMGTNGDASTLTNFPTYLLRTNGDAAALTNFPASLLRTNGDAAALTNFPANLLRTNGDGSGLTNLPNANLTNATGVLPLANGGTGATNASNARTALGLGTAATNAATNFQTANTNLTALASGDGSNLTNVTITDASSLTNFPSFLLQTNGSAGSLTNFPSDLMRTNGNAATLTNFPASLLRTNGDGSGLSNVATYPSLSNNASKVLAVTTNETGVEWLAVSNTVTDASLLTNFPALLLTTNGNAAGLTNFPVQLLRTNGDAAALTNFPTLNQSTTGTASNVTGVIATANGGTGASNADNARINLLPSYTGNQLRVLALNSNATDVVWSVDGGGQANMTNVTNTLAIANGGTGATNVLTALTNLAILGGSSSVHIAPTTTNAVGNFNVTIGVGAFARPNATGSVSIGYQASVDDGGESGGIAIGRGAVCTNGVAIGYGSANLVGTGGRGVAIGYLATNSATGGAQIGTGRNTNASTIQFLSAGSVNTNKWNYLANASTAGGSRMTNTNGVTATNTIIGYDGTNYTTNTITVIDGIITSWTQ